MKRVTLKEAIGAVVGKRQDAAATLEAEQHRIMRGMPAACDKAIRESMARGCNQATAGYILPKYAPETVEMLQKEFPGFQIWYGKSMAEGSPNAQINVMWPHEQEPPMSNFDHG